MAGQPPVESLHLLARSLTRYLEPVATGGANHFAGPGSFFVLFPDHGYQQTFCKTVVSGSLQLVNASSDGRGHLEMNPRAFFS
nr:hypothetical protein [uncultured Desulfobulbus sp.]